LRKAAFSPNIRKVNDLDESHLVTRKNIFGCNMDLDAIRHDFLLSLSHLKDASRPIINNLTIIAKESAEAAPAIVAAIAERELTVLPP
jgi:hypothetical protein